MRGIKHFFSVLPIDTKELTIRGIGVQEHMPLCIVDRPRGTNDYLFIFFYDPVWIGTGGKPAFHPPGTLVLWAPGQAQHYGNRNQPYNHTWIHCDGTFIRNQLRANRLACNMPLPLSDPSLMEQHLIAIHTELTNQGRPDPVIVRNLLENWLRTTARTLQRQRAADAIPKPLLAIRHFIESEYASPLDLPDLAARSKLSVSHFCALFKRHFGLAPIEYLIRHRMHQAAYLLRDREVTISEAGRRVGYEDLFHFSKLFKKHFGASPRHWRSAGGQVDT